MDGPITKANDTLDPLTDEEITSFFNDLDTDKDGYVTFAEIEAKLHQVHEELAPEPKRHHLNHPSRRDVEKGEEDCHPGNGLHAFLCALMPDCGAKVDRHAFAARVKAWEVPSQRQTATDDHNSDGDATQLRQMPRRRHIRAYLAVHGPRLCFLAFVIALQLAFGLWQLISYLLNMEVRAALGWGVVIAKVCAGVLYPTLFFMLLSMSRHFATLLRRSYWVSRFVDWDRSQSFHIKMSLVGLFFASLHAIGHLTGSFLTGSRPSRQQAVAQILGPDAVPRPYVAYVRSLPGWSGIVALGLFWTITLLSMPVIRKRMYEIFQMGHLLMFPMIGLLCAHGTAALLQAPMLGYWLAFPTLLVLGERLHRLIRGFMRVPARVRMLDDHTVLVTCRHPRGRDWRYSAGQYILLQVPQVSVFQWHPFTISSCQGDELQVHIKLDGDWTNALSDVLPENEDICVGADGPFGAPAQRFYDYDYAIVVGGGIGITPFAAILTDLEQHEDERRDPWAERRRSRSLSRRRSQAGESDTIKAKDSQDTTPSDQRTSRRRVDFHWTVREKNNLLWFSDLLNRAIDGAQPQEDTKDILELHINTHITAKRKNISTHIFRYLLDSYRTDAAPYSALTGLKQPSHFGRPDFDKILDKHFDEMVASGTQERRVVVFYCGAPVVGEILSDKCHSLTTRARHMGLRIRYDFLMEVFG
ncbi:hypothetical protein BAUCODRAFT_117170 [Baudoinia panamericana UAMH 10762]|uniref:FAD-binding FR-type domain-containing protein n=1 Tax=Baudoinia panamericana (strain UAMH 10762) TaxID=717646 RepID=M2LDD5_BAUPA|nr:uncharacterized protein BAUCODRAFT_117170 [Baudoinia panamericana UAMH 10762]EMC91977.1 hypothetical protein BAUCODRAFT_117170 [Baudoinia panamericana UAMH 10762]